MAGVTTAILATAAVASSAAGYFEQKKAGRKAERNQEKARKTSQASAQVENARQRRRAIAQQRMAAAQNRANMSQETQSSSGLSGVQSSLGTQTGANIGFQTAKITSQEMIGDYNQKAATALRVGQERAGLANLGSQIFTMGAQSGGFGSGGSGGRSQSSAPQSSGFVPSDTPGARPMFGNR